MPFKPSLTRLGGAIAAVVALQAGVIQAQDIDTIVITAQRDALEESSIDQQRLENTQASDLEDIFRQTPQVNVGGGLGVAQKIYLRGIEDSNLNISIDGATQAGALFHHQGRVNVEPELLKRVEVSAGAGLASDGPGALGGSIRFVTKDPEELLREGEDVGALVKLGYFSNSKGVKASSSVFGRLTDNVSLLASLVKTDTGNYKDGKGATVEDTKGDKTSGLIKLVANIDDEQTLRVSYDESRDDGRRKVRPQFIAFDRNPANNQESHRQTTNVQYELASDNPLLDLESNLYFTKSYITQDPDDSDHDGAGIKSLGLNVNNTFELSDHSLELGINLRHDTGYYINAPASTTNPSKDEKAEVAGIYLQDTFAATDKLDIFAGARFDSYRLKDNIGQHFSDSGISPNLGFDYQVNEALNLFANHAWALRGVGVKEAYLLNFATYDKNTQATKAKNSEIGFKYQKGNLSAGVTAFYTEIKNPIERTQRSVLSNSDDVRSKGVTARVGYKWGKLNSQLSYSVSKPTQSGEPVSGSANFVGSTTGDTIKLNLDTTLDNGVQLGWSSKVVRSATSGFTNNPKMPSYNVHDAFAKWSPASNKDLSLTLSVNNIFDEDYIEHASFQGVDDNLGLKEAGQDVRLTVALRF